MHFLAIATAFSAIVAQLTVAAPTAEITEVAKPFPHVQHTKRDTIDFTDIGCTTECYYGNPGTGPNEYDCSQIINEFWSYGSAKFSVDPNSYNYEVWGSCLLTFHNPSSYTELYQFNELATVADYIRSTCNAANNAAGGRCTFSSNVVQTPYIELIHST